LLPISAIPAGCPPVSDATTQATAAAIPTRLQVRNTILPMLGWSTRGGGCGMASGSSASRRCNSNTASSPLKGRPLSRRRRHRRASSAVT